MEMVEDGLIEVDEEKFGQYGTITIGALYGTDSASIQDQKYCIFTISDSDLLSLEQNMSGYKIRAQEYLRRSKPVDSSAVREVIQLPRTLSISDYCIWGREPVIGIMPPITKSIYLSTDTQVFGPFMWEQIAADQYKFAPYSTSEDPYTVRCYDKADFEDPIYTFDAAKRNTDLLLGKERNVLLIGSLPSKFVQVDCIDDIKLKDFVGRLLSQSAETKKEKREIQDAIAALPVEQISEERKRRILELVKNGELADQTVNLIPTILMADENSIKPIVDKILSNVDYTSRIYPMVKNQEGFKGILDKLEQEKSNKEAELRELDARITKAKEQSRPDESISSEKVNQLNIEIEKLNQQLGEYKNLTETQRKYDETKEKYHQVKAEHETMVKIKDALSSEIQQKVQSAYSDFAFDGALSSLMLQEATRYERERNQKALLATTATIESIQEHSGISTPGDLTEFLYRELNEEANRIITKNDVANILLCVSQGFLTVFAGDPGSGKTSLVSLVATILGLANDRFPRYTEIAVEKGWTSRRDLIGYYNPLTKSFDAANKGLFSALSTLGTEAKNNISDFPYWVLLDEANLSQMEHYWADFMSLCDFDKPRRRISISEDFEFLIPDTLRFLATINLDHTTEILSPRLIDRAWIIKLQASDLDIDDYIDRQMDVAYPMVDYNVFRQLYFPKYWESTDLDSAIVDKFNRVRALFQGNGINFSPRVIGMIKRYCLASKGLMDESENSYVALDYAVAQKILPMINGYGETYQKFIDDLIKECDQATMPHCYVLLNEIQKRGSANMQYYQFFAR